MSYGMSYADYWDGDNELPKYYRELAKIRVKERDYQDSHREIAPLKQADDAILVDSTEMDLPATINYMLNIIKERI